MDKSSDTDMSTQLSKISTPTSPKELDQRILDYARKHAPETPHNITSQWLPATVAFSVAVIAVLLIQPTAKLPLLISTNEDTQTSDSQTNNTEDSINTTIKETPASITSIKRELSDSAMSISAYNAAGNALPDTIDAKIMKSQRTGEQLLTNPKELHSQPTLESKQLHYPTPSVSKKLTARKIPKPTLVDNDNDGLPNDWEQQFNLDMNNPNDADTDLDNDGLSNLEEYQLKTNPTLADTDGDLIPDGWEKEQGLNPLIKDKEIYLQKYYHSLKTQ